MYLGHVCEILIHTLWAPQDVASCIYSEAKQGERDEDDDCKDTHQSLRNTHTTHMNCSTIFLHSLKLIRIVKPSFVRGCIAGK